MLVAITRGVSPSINRCELTHRQRVPIDLATARRQHRQYEATLESLGVALCSLPPEPDLPDAVFVEDTAVVLDECAVITRSAVDSRRAETGAIARALAPYRRLFHMQPPGTLDGGDVLCIGRHVYVGLSTRSNESGLDQMRAFLEPYGYSITDVSAAGYLHLKSAVTQVAADTLLINPNWVPLASFPGMKFVAVDPSEPHAANALLVGESVIHQPDYPRTGARLDQAGLRVVPVDVSELGKAEGALTCCSLLFRS